MGEEKYLLRWNEFEQNLGQVFKRYRSEKIFYDITLVCGLQGEDVLQAHKVVLSASSTFFESVLRTNVHSHPLVYLKGVRTKDLESILDYIYHGETNVALSDLDAFLEVATDLKIKGLMSPKDTPESLTSPPCKMARRSEPSYQPPAPTPSIGMQGYRDTAPSTEMQGYRDTAPGTEMQSIEEEEESLNTSGGSGYDCREQEDTNYSFLNKNKFEDVKRLTDQYLARQDDGQGGVIWCCTCCGKTGRMKHHVREHVESNHIDCLSFTCPFCQKEIKNRVALRSHISKNHREENLRSKAGFVA